MGVEGMGKRHGPRDTVCIQEIPTISGFSPWNLPSQPVFSADMDTSSIFPFTAPCLQGSEFTVNRSWQYHKANGGVISWTGKASKQSGKWSRYGTLEADDGAQFPHSKTLVEERKKKGGKMWTYPTLLSYNIIWPWQQSLHPHPLHRHPKRVEESISVRSKRRRQRLRPWIVGHMHIDPRSSLHNQCLDSQQCTTCCWTCWTSATPETSSDSAMQSLVLHHYQCRKVQMYAHLHHHQTNHLSITSQNKAPAIYPTMKLGQIVV